MRGRWEGVQVCIVVVDLFVTLPQITISTPNLSPELDDIETIGENDVRLPLKQMLRLLSCYLGNGTEDVCAVCGCPLQTVAVVDLSVTCLCVHIEL